MPELRSVYRTLVATHIGEKSVSKSREMEWFGETFWFRKPSDKKDWHSLKMKNITYQS